MPEKTFGVGSPISLNLAPSDPPRIMFIFGSFPLLFFVGGYVTHTPLPALQSSLVAVAGPLTNLVLWLLALAVVKYNLIDKKYYKIIVPLGKINMFLLIFNMLPLPGFDGYHFFAGLFRAFL